MELRHPLMITGIPSAIASLAQQTFRILHMRRLLTFARPALLALLPLNFVQAQGPCPMPATIELRVLLEGPLDSLTGLMNDDLRAAGLIPLTEPYTTLGYAHRGGGGGEVTTAAMFETTGNDAIVDWVVVEVRYPNDPGRLLLSRSALIQRDGDVVDADGSNLLSLCVAPGLWHLAVRHRNHLGIMTGSPVEFLGGQSGPVFADPVDLSSPSTPAHRDGASRRKMGDRMAMWNGDVTFDGQVKYTGSGNDRDPILLQIGSTTPNNLDIGYVQSDVNLDAVAKYTGNGNDRDALLRTVGGTTPNNVREGYIPKDSLTLRPNVHVIDDLPLVLDTTRSDIDSNTVMVYAIGGAIPEINVDHIMIGEDPSGGYLRKVVSASVLNDSLFVTTVQANLSEVFASGTMNLTIAPEAPTGRAFYYIEPIPLINSSAATVTIEDINFNFSGTSLCDATFGPTGLVAGEFATRGVNIGLNYKLKFQGTLFTDTAEWLPLKTTIASGMQLIYGIPVFYDIILSAKLAGKVEFYGAVSSETNVGVSFQADLGVAYDMNSGFTNINSFSFPTPDLDTKIDDIGLGFKGSLKWTPEVQLKLYKVGGPYFSSGPSASAVLRVTGTGNGITHDIKSELKWKTQAGVKMKILDFHPDHAFVHETEPFARYNSPVLMDTSSTEGNHQVALPGATLPEPLKVCVKGVLDFPLLDEWVDPISFNSELVPVDFAVVGGGGSLAEHRVYTDLTNGCASTQWTLGMGPLDQQRVRAWVRNGVGDTIATPIEFTVDSAYHSLQAISPLHQIGTDGTPLSQDVHVRLVNMPTGEPVAGEDVHFIVSGGGSVSDVIVTTDTSGNAMTSWTLPLETTDPQVLRAYVLDLLGDTIHPGSLTFTATYGPIGAATMGNANNNSGTAGSSIPITILLERTWAEGQTPEVTPLSGKLVSFQTQLGNGTYTDNGSAMTAVDGIATKIITLPATHGTHHGRAFHVNTFGDTTFALFNYYVCDACPASVTDVDGITYPVVNIGCQCWMAKNLGTTHFRNGDPIPLGTNIPTGHPTIADDKLAPLTSPARAAKFFNNANAPTYGWLYNYHAISDVRGLCPNGWKLPSQQEWELLKSAAGDTISGPALRANNGTWEVPPPEYLPDPHLDTYGFSLLPGLSIPSWCCPNENPCCAQTEAQFLDDLAGEDATLWTKDGSQVFTCYTCLEIDVDDQPVLPNSGKAFSCRCILDE